MPLAGLLVWALLCATAQSLVASAGAQSNRSASDWRKLSRAGDSQRPEFKSKRIDVDLASPVNWRQLPSVQQQQQQKLPNLGLKQLVFAQSTEAPALRRAIQQQQLGQAKQEDPLECRWLNLREFSAITLEPEELIARDSADQPMYSLRASAYLRTQNSDLFIPLRHFRPPGRKTRSSSYRWWPLGAANQTGWPLAQLRCSISNEKEKENENENNNNNNTDTDTQAPVSLAQVSLANGSAWPERLIEQLIVQVDCGYLVLDLLASHPAAESGALPMVELSSISFYQNWAGELSTLGSPQAWREHMVFTSSSPPALPLLRMPLLSRFRCAHRVELAGQLGRRLVLDHFELIPFARPAHGPASQAAQQAELGPGLRPKRSPSVLLYRNQLTGGEYSARADEQLLASGQSCTTKLIECAPPPLVPSLARLTRPFDGNLSFSQQICKFYLSLLLARSLARSLACSRVSAHASRVLP